MIRIHPDIAASGPCPRCGDAADAVGWTMPGMRALGEFACGSCSMRFLRDLPTGHGLTMPSTLDPATGEVLSPIPERWFADWLADGWRRRSRAVRDLDVDVRRPARRAAVVNCLDALYGHALLKLLTAQRILDQHPDLDLVAIVPRFLRWLVPDGVAEVWSVDLPLREGAEWNDELGEWIGERIRAMDEAFLAPALPHPHLEDVQIERFTRVSPFPLEEWAERLAEPTLSFAWRDDRCWAPPLPRGERLARRVGRGPDARQTRRLVAFAEGLRARMPGLRFVVLGLGRPGGLPGWVEDERVERVDDAVERRWCELYAASHVAVGVHGSNMLLPSAHAGAVVDLMPADRWGNALQDLLPRPGDLREALFRTRLLPLETGPGALAGIVASLLADHAWMTGNLGPAGSRPDPQRIASDTERRPVGVRPPA